MINKLTEKPVKWLTLEDCETLYKEYKTRVDTALPSFSTRYPDRLESILGSITLIDDFSSPTILDTSSAYFNKFVRSQCFMNGNKRMGVLFTHYFLLNHGIDFTLTYKELFYFAATIAKASENHVSMDKTFILCQKVLTDFTKGI